MILDRESQYLAAAFPMRWRVCGLKLERFTLGHAHILAASTAWRPLCDLPEPDGFFSTALLITSRPWRKAEKAMERGGGAFPFFLAIKLRLAKADLAKKWEVFCDYLEASTLFPRVAQMPARPGVASRAAGASFLCRLRLFAMRDLGLGDKAMDLAFTDAAWLFSSHREEIGASRMKNDDEIAFDDFCREQDRLRAEKRKASQCGG